jgi:outer membrane putative beta-barrel porin/alpha-amylase
VCGRIHSQLHVTPGGTPHAVSVVARRINEDCHTQYSSRGRRTRPGHCRCPAGPRPGRAPDLLSTSVDYSVGDYGTGKNTTLVYVPFTLGVRPLDRFWLSVTVPFLYQHGQNVVITGGGVASRKGQKGKFAQPAQSKTEEGLGDVLLKASVILIPEKEFIPEVTPYFKVKFPTADKDRGLGTGEFDETLGVDVSKRLIASLFGYLELAYTFIGEPAGTTLHNSFGWSVGAGYAIVPPFSVFAFLEGATAISPGQEDPLDLRVGAELKLVKALRVSDDRRLSMPQS